MSLFQKCITTHFEWLEKMFSECETLAKQQCLFHLAGFGVSNRNKINVTQVSVIKNGTGHKGPSVIKAYISI